MKLYIQLLVSIVFVIITLSMCYAPDDSSKISSHDNSKTLLDQANLLLNSNPERAYQQAIQAYQKSKIQNNKDEEAQSYFLMGQASLKMGRFKEADSCLKEAHLRFRILKNYQKEADALRYLGNIKQILSNYDEAFDLYQKALQKYKTINNRQGKALIIRDIGDLYTEVGNYNAALQKQLESIEIFDNTQDKQGLAVSFISIGNVYIELDKLEEATQYFKKALKILNEYPDIRSMALIYSRLGEVEKRKKNYAVALGYTQKALKIQKEQGDSDGYSQTLSNVGEIYLITNKIEEALQCFQQANQNFKNSGRKQGFIVTSTNIGKTYLKLKKYSEAEFHFKQGFKVAEEMHSADLLKDISFQLSTLYDSIQNYKQALFYSNLSSSLKDSIFNQSIANNISKLKFQFGIQNQEQTQEYKQQFWAYVVTVILLIVLFFVGLLLRNRWKLKKANVQLAEQYGEITVTEEELMEANIELKRNAERFQLIVLNLPVIISAMDSEGLYVLWNKECERVTGFHAHEMLGNPEALKMLYAEEYEQKKSLLQQRSDYRDIETTITCKDGQKKIISWSNVSNSVPIPGWLVWSIGIDITERCRFEHSLKREKSLLDSLINSIPDLIFYKGTNGAYLGCNPAFAEFYGFKSEDLIGKRDDEMFDAELASFFQQADRDILFNKTPQQNERWTKRKTGETVLLDTKKTPFFGANGEVLGLVGVSRDITHRYKIEEALQKAKEKAEKADHLKTAFLSNMSHEIRTPMNAIIGFASLLSTQNLTQEQQREYIEYINNSGNNLLNLIDDIIDTAKIEAGEIRIKYEKTNVHRILRELHATYSEIKRQKYKSDVELRLKMAIEDENFFIFTDPFRVRQVLTNLIGNAMKFIDKGYIEFGYSIEQITPENEHKIKREKTENEQFLEFSVKDTGIGIPKEKFDEIFMRFGQVHDVQNRNRGGTGLGLTISRNLVELLGGKIWVESKVGEGSSFFFTIPYKYAKSETTKEAKTEQHRASYDNCFVGKTILVAEDELMNYKLVEIALKKTNAKVIRAENGKIAVELFMKHYENEKFDLVLMDIQMPIMDGYQAIREIKKIDNSIPVIAQTAFAMADEKRTTIEAGFDDYISKPIKHDELYEILSKYLLNN